MKKCRKCIATVLVFSMVISVAGCSGNFDESMVNIADKVCGCIADGDYSKASKYFDDKNKKLEEAMISSRIFSLLRKLLKNVTIPSSFP